MDLKCKKCGSESVKLNNINFGDAEYEQYMCKTCNKVEYKCVGVKMQ